MHRFVLTEKEMELALKILKQMAEKEISTHGAIAILHWLDERLEVRKETALRETPLKNVLKEEDYEMKREDCIDGERG